MRRKTGEIGYFLTYTMAPGHPSTMTVKDVYGVAHAQQVVRTAMHDYTAKFGPVNGSA